MEGGKRYVVLTAWCVPVPGCEIVVAPSRDLSEVPFVVERGIGSVSHRNDFWEASRAGGMEHHHRLIFDCFELEVVRNGRRLSGEKGGKIRYLEALEGSGRFSLQLLDDRDNLGGVKELFALDL